MNENTKIICPGRGRAGSTLLAQLLNAHPNITPWLPEKPTDRYDVQPDVKDIIREHFPHVLPQKLYKEGDWNFVKCPEFALVIRDLVELYPDCKFLVLDRALEERVQSSLKVNAHGWIRKAFEKNKDFLCLTSQLLDLPEKKLLDLPETYVRAWWMIHDWNLEAGLMRVAPEQVLRVPFHAWMKDFRPWMARIATFCRIPLVTTNPRVSWLDRWDKMRRMPFQLSAHKPSYWG